MDVSDVSEPRPFVSSVDVEDVDDLLLEWRWLIGRAMTPLFLTALGDWIFGAPDGSLWALDMLEGELRLIASNAAEYNRLKASRDWLDEQLLLGWYEIALGNGIVVTEGECLGWAVHPLLGGELARSNLKTFSMRVYQSLMGQIHRQLQR